MSRSRQKEKKKGSGIVTNNLYMLKLVWKVCPKRVVVDFILSAAEYFSWVFYSVIFIKYLIGAIEAGQSFETIAIFIGGSMLIFLFIDLLGKWYELRFKPLTDNIIYLRMNEMLFDKATNVEISCYEDAQFYNAYTLAIKEVDTRASSVLQNLPRIIFAVMAATGILGAMYSIDRYVILFAVFPLIGNFVFGKVLNKLNFSKDQESIPFRRRMDYVNRTVYLQNFAKEIRLSNIFNVLKEIYEHGYKGIIEIIKKYSIRTGLVQILHNLSTFLFIFEGVMLYGAYRALVSGTIAVSEFAVLASAMVSASWIIIRLSENITASIQNGIYIENLRKFLSYESKIPEDQGGITPERNINLLELRNVEFTYKGQEEPVLSNINIKISGKEKIALVGHNGAGKTTLIKLLMRLYDPQKGQLLLNGNDIRELDLKQYRELFGTAFQDYQVFSMTIAENVLMREPEDNTDRERVKDALIKSGVYEKVMSLEKNIDTILTREFAEDGVVLSGGELQKIAIARAFAKDFKIAIFDEPSSALDPIAEYKLYESMMEACRGSAVIFISHRLSSAALADRIYMLEKGRIVEEGSHMELVKRGGKYADMFKKQAEKYVENECVLA